MILESMFTAAALPAFTSYTYSDPRQPFDWYIQIVDGYYSVAGSIGGVVLAVLTFFNVRKIWFVNLIFQSLLIISILVSIAGFGPSVLYTAADMTLILSSVIVWLLISSHRQQYSRFLNRSAIFFKEHSIAVISGTAIGLVAGFWVGAFDPWLSYSDLVYGSMPNPEDRNEQLYVTVTQTSTTLAANTPSSIQVTLNMNYSYRQNHHLNASENEPQRFWLIFDGSDCGSFILPHGTCIKPILRYKDNLYIGNYYPVTYSHEGDYKIRLATSLRSANYSTTTTDNVIHIAPTSDTNGFRLFKMSIIIGVIAGAIALVTIFRPEPRQNTEFRLF
jgi:hypothetical protein